MQKVIVYEEAGGYVCVFYPSDKSDVPLTNMGHTVVPDGTPFWIVDPAIIPTDRVFRDAWRLDVQSMGSPHGVGDTAAFTAWQAEKEGNNQ